MKTVQLFWKFIQSMDAKRLSGQKNPDGVTEQNNIPYTDSGHKYHLLDVYRPEGEDGKLPVIVDIHGGGWFYGDKDLNKKYCLHLAKFGFAVVNISYRLAPEVSYEKQVEDCFLALKWIENNAEKYNLDINNLFLTGDSAGGHLAGLIANIMSSVTLQELFGQKSDIKVKAIGFTCAAFNLTSVCKIPGAGLYFRSIYGKDYKKSKYYTASDFSANIPSNLPPSFLITCKGDLLRKCVLKTYDALKAKGADCELCYYEKPLVEGHKLQHVYNVLQPWWEESVDTNTRMIEFFKKYIK